MILRKLPMLGRLYATIARLDAERIEALRRVEQSEARRLAAEAEIRDYCDQEIRRLNERIEASSALNRALTRERDAAVARLPDLTFMKGSVERIVATLAEKNAVVKDQTSTSHHPPRGM
ncbi:MULTISPECIES: hypothetical protein [unclassified Bosea (in: a-proteobacteria)]|uniref:hypothetical protein n=1 Tax=unclassified Bosea (in: a-proteobacteria) TaxID=2653178 RepID=UPI000F74DA65|nr:MULTISPECIES: hypothetical protein [unclassified Bosea (in: a-proteobacteria)]AZO77462.1 hypothetical protein BLM15_07450 [Bosea sp. Tri-49]RXT18069.1 hypothetical protein B5U98_22605 [Bosea sp. Tri-39]RXT32667.1 hypothetical protein B5U99_28950 [Bosea sp. Tri-54]